MKGIITHKYNWDDYGYLSYLDKLNPILYNGETLLLDEEATWEPNRETLYNRCLYGYTYSLTIDLGSSFTTFSLLGWYNRGNDWQYGNITFSSLSSGVLTLEKDTYYKSFERYENGVLIDTALLEEGFGTNIYFDSGDSTTISSELLRTTLNSAPLLPNSGDILGYGNLNQVNVDNIISGTNYDNIIDVNNAGFVEDVSSQKRARWSVVNANLWLYNTKDGSGYLYNVDGTSNISGTVNELTAGFYDDPTYGYYLQTYATGNYICTYRDFNPDLSQSKYSILFSTDTTGNTLIRNNQGANDWNGYWNSVWSTDPDGPTYLDLGIYSNGSDATIISAKAWYDFLVTENRESEVDDFLLYYNTNFADAYTTVVNAGTPTTQRITFMYQLEQRTPFTAGDLQVEENDSSVCNLYSSNPSSNNNRAMAWAEGKEIEFIDYFDFSFDSLGYLKLYLEYFIFQDQVILPKKTNSDKDINNYELSYKNRKNFPITVGGVAVLLDTTRNKDIQSSIALTDYEVTAVYGEVATTGEQIQVTDIGIDVTNYIRQSEDFTTSDWIASIDITVTANTTTNPINGATTADTLAKSVSDSPFRNVYQTVNIAAAATLTIGEEYTFSVYVKNIDSSGGRFYVPTANYTANVDWDIDGVDVGDGWRRHSYTITAVATTDQFYIYPEFTTGAGSIYVFGAMLNKGDVAGIYKANNSSTSTAGLAPSILYNNNASGYDIKLARVDLSDGTTTIRLAYLGGLDNNDNEVASDTLWDCEGGENHATILYDTQDYHTSQNYYNHWVLYGASQDKVFSLNFTDPLSFDNGTNIGKSIPFNCTIYNFEVDISDNRILDDEGQLQGYTIIDNENVVNIYNTGTYSSSNLVRIPNILIAAGNIRIVYDKLKPNGIGAIVIEDSWLQEKFNLEIDAYYNSGAASLITNTVAKLFNTLNGGVDTTGLNFPNGGDDDYPNTTLGINTGAGYAYNATSTKIREILDYVFVTYGDGDGDSIKWMESLVADNRDTASATGADSFTKIVSVIPTEVIGANEIILTTSNILSTSSAGSTAGTTFFLNYERVFKRFDTFYMTRGSVEGGLHLRFKIIDINGTDLLSGLTDSSNKDCVFNRDNEYPYGIYLNAIQKKYVQLPQFKTLEYALQSNEEIWRDTTDSQGNAVLDRHLVPLSLEHSDKDFPCLKSNDDNSVVTVTTPFTTPLDGDSIRFEIYINDYVPVLYTSVLIGRDYNGGDYYIGLYQDSLRVKIGGTQLEQSTGLDLQTVSNFIFDITITRISSTVYSILFYIKDSINNVLYQLNQTHDGSNLSLDTLMGRVNTGSVISTPDCSMVWGKAYINNALTNWWVYTGGNSLLLQDKVGDNHGSLTTNDVTLNQATQNVFNPFENGYNIKGLTQDFKGTHGAVSVLQSPDVSTFTVNSQYNFSVSGTDASPPEPSETARVNGVWDNYAYNTMADGDVAQFYVKLRVRNTGSRDFWLSIDISDTQLTTITDGYTKLPPPSNDETLITTSMTDWQTLELVNEDKNKQLSSHQDFLDIKWLMYTGDIDTDFSFDIEILEVRQYFGDYSGDDFTSNGYNEFNLTTLPKYPYDGTDIFGNTLSTPRTNKVARVQRYTNNI